MNSRQNRLLVCAILCFVVLGTYPRPAYAGFYCRCDSPCAGPINGGYLYGEVGASGYGHTGVDFVLSSGNPVHNVDDGYSGGPVRFSGCSLTLAEYGSGTARGGGSDYIILATSASASDGFYIGKVIWLNGGTGAGPSRTITGYVGSTRTAYVSSSDPWNRGVPTTSTTYQIGTYKGYGEHVIVECYTGHWMLYAHLQRRLVFEGQYLATRQQIGESGATGNVTGPHLHFEARDGANSLASVINPEYYLARSDEAPRGALRGLVTDSGGTPLREVRVHGATRPDDIKFGAAYTYALNQYAGPGPFLDVTRHGINYYIGRAASGSVQLTLTKTGYGTRYYGTSVDGGVDKLLVTLVMQ